MKPLAILVPTRRPRNIARLLDDMQATHTEATLVLGVDLDDDVREYQALNQHPYWRDTRIITGKRTQPGMGQAINRTYRAVANDYQHFVFLGDDAHIKTPQWDAIVLTKLNELTHGVVYWDDEHYGQALCTHWAVTGQTVRAWGKFVPDTYHHLFLDNFYMELGQDLNSLHYLTDVVIEHVHPAWQKTAWDALYLQTNNPDFFDHDRQAHQQFLASEEYAQLIATLTKGKASD